MAEAAWLIPALPAVSAAAIFAVGRRLPKQGAEIGILGLAVAFLLSLAVAVQVFGVNVGAAAAHGEGHAAAFLVERSALLARAGDLVVEAGIRVDGLATMMFLLVTFVSLAVHVYSTGYMHGDPRYTYYFGVLSLFTASMLLLVIANNLLMLLVGWELVGVCSYLLIGFWWENKANQDAAIKAFITTKLGDVGLMVGVVTLGVSFATFNIGEIIEAVEIGDYRPGLLTFALLALFVGCVGKSAQFPLHTWLPDAMAGPTPVSALIHAATMVTAGVFLIARLYPVFSESPAAMAVIAVVGAVTLFMAGLLALVQDDVKRVLAYSTISQLGYMVAALAFSYTAGVFHLFTHGFFKALLFLGAGSVIHAAHSNNMSDMGGLRRVMPTTFWTFVVGALALAALPPLAGFWSKDEVLAGALGAGGYTGTLVAALGTLGGLVTAFYMTRVLYLVFTGDYRGEAHPHESPPVMTAPLVILAVPAALAGLVNLPFDFAHPYGFAAWTMFDVEYFEGHPAEFNLLLAVAATLLAVGGILAGRALYRRAPAHEPMLELGLISRVLVNKYYLDLLYNDVIVRPLRDRVAAGLYWLDQHVIDDSVRRTGAGTARLGRVTYDYGDQRAIDGAVNGLGVSTNWSGGLLKFAQSGNVQLYAGAMFVGVVVLAIAFAAA
ncbi:MAG: NADH-quinone oxidoreductase subunit L [Actinomycetota bacterium]|nr:NADH-quinone oxidoreductase subunit L [Actinomycetota bacterium]